MIYDQCMQQLLTFIMTVVGEGDGEGEREWGCVGVCECMCVRISLWGVCGEDEG